MKWIDFNNFLDVHGALWANYLVKIQHTKFQIYNLLTNNSVFHYQVVVDFYFSHILVRLITYPFEKEPQFANLPILVKMLTFMHHLRDLEFVIFSSSRSSNLY